MRERNETAAHAPSSPPPSQASADLSSSAAVPLTMHHLLGSPTHSGPKHSAIPPSPLPSVAVAPALQPTVDASQLVHLLQAKLSSGELSAGAATFRRLNPFFLDIFFRMLCAIGLMPHPAQNLWPLFCRRPPPHHPQRMLTLLSLNLLFSGSRLLHYRHTLAATLIAFAFRCSTS